LQKASATVTLRRIVIDEVSDDQAGIAAAQRVTGRRSKRPETCERREVGTSPDPGARARSSTARPL